jgi:predicted nucleotide-binding protein
MNDELFKQMNNAVLDLQSAEYQTYERPLKRLAKLLRDPSLEKINHELTVNVDLDLFLAENDSHVAGMVGSDKLNWPDETEQTIALTWLLIQKLSIDENFTFQFSHHYFSSGSSQILAGLRSMTGQMIIPFVRDYIEHVRNTGALVKGSRKVVSGKEVFIVHGHDDAALQGLARFIEQLGLVAIVLKEQPDKGQTIIEKFEACATQVGFAVILLTPDDVGSSVAASNTTARARQNVIFELGYFTGTLGRSRVCLLRKGSIEFPSDFSGVIYTDMDAADGWKIKLVKELRAAGLPVSTDKAF